MLFRTNNSKLIQIKEVTLEKERDLQRITEESLEIIFGLQFVKTEFQIQSFRIDTLAFDKEDMSFVIIEYKRDSSFSIVDQGYSYLSSMLSNKAEFVLAYNEIFKKNFKKEDIDWESSKVIFVAKKFNGYQLNATNFKEMPFELWEVEHFEGNLLQFKQIKKSENIPSFKQIKNTSEDKKRVVREIKTYSEEDVFNKQGISSELYESLKGKILQTYPDLTFSPKKNYIGFSLADNYRNVFNIRGISGGVRIDFMRSKPKDFDDPQNKIQPLPKAMEYWHQDISTLVVKNGSDERYAMLIISQAYDRFTKEFGN